MPQYITKPGTNYVFDPVTGDIVGVMDPDGSINLFSGAGGIEITVTPATSVGETATAALPDSYLADIVWQRKAPESSTWTDVSTSSGVITSSYTLTNTVAGNEIRPIARNIIKEGTKFTVASVVLYGTSFSVFDYTHQPYTDTSTTETLNINDSSDNGNFTVRATAGTYTKTVTKQGTGTSEVFAEGKIGYVTLGAGDSITLADTVTLKQAHCIAALVRLPNTATAGYSGFFEVLKSLENGESGNPFFTFGIAGDLHPTTFIRNQVATLYEAKTGLSSLTGFQALPAVVGAYGQTYNFFDGTDVSKKSSDWFWIFRVGYPSTNTFTLRDNLSLAGTTGTYKNRIICAQTLHQDYEGNPNTVAMRVGHGAHNYAPAITATGSFSAGELTLTGVSGGNIEVDQSVYLEGVSTHYFIKDQLSGTTGGDGVYRLKNIYGSTLTTSTFTTGAVNIGGAVSADTTVTPIIGGATTGATEIDVARVMVLDGQVMPVHMSLIAQGYHPKSLGFDTNSLVLDLGALPTGATAAGTPVFNTDSTSPKVMSYRGTNATDVTVSVNNEVIA